MLSGVHKGFLFDSFLVATDSNNKLYHDHKLKTGETQAKAFVNEIVNILEKFGIKEKILVDQNADLFSGSGLIQDINGAKQVSIVNDNHSITIYNFTKQNNGTYEVSLSDQIYTY